LAVEQLGTGDVLLYLEALRPLVRWPWRDTVFAGQVLERLAGLHSAKLSADTRAVLAAWDYESELQASAGSTMELLMRCGRDRRLPSLAGTLQPARRVALAIGAVRRQLLAFSSFGGVAIHGDMHPGNALVRRKAGAAEPAFLDWARARIGSSLEDVSSWLQSLGYWEPETRRRHDSLLVRYLRARGAEDRLRPEFRAAYWLAGASNALSGALRYHLAVALDPRTGNARRASAVRSARDWLRVLRRADAFWN
jgi:Ser/Thr protein kinase RdoA (MazF antagonist)